VGGASGVISWIAIVVVHGGCSLMKLNSCASAKDVHRTDRREGRLIVDETCCIWQSFFLIEMTCMQACMQ